MSIAPSSLLESGAIALATMVKLFMRRNTRAEDYRFVLRSSRTWKKQFENRAAHARSLDTHFTAVVLHDLLNDRKSKSDSFFFPVADERLKQIFEDRLWNSGAIIGHAN